MTRNDVRMTNSLLAVLWKLRPNMRLVPRRDGDINPFGI